MAKILKIVADLVLAGQTEFAMETYEELSDVAMLMESALEDIKEEVENAWEAHKNIEAYKDFAAIAERYDCQHFLFQIKKGAIKDPSEINKCINAKNLIEETRKRHESTFELLYNEVTERKD